MAIAEWRQRLIAEVIGVAKAHGIDFYDESAVKGVFEALAANDRTKPSKEDRIGANWLLQNTNDRGLKLFFTQVRTQWDSIGPKPQEEGAGPPVAEMEAAASDGRLQGVLSAKLTPGSKLTGKFLEAYLRQSRIRFHVCRSIALGGGWIDLHLTYDSGLRELYDLLYKHPEVEDVMAKPVADFGRITAAYPTTATKR
jgi:hypothetical protein